MAKTTTKANKTNVENIVETQNKVPTETVTVKESVKPREYKDTDMILCRSLVPGILIMPGYKNGGKYRWNGIGDTAYVEYGDLQHALTRRVGYLTTPLIYIEDEELLLQGKWKQLKDVYANMYSEKDFKDLLKQTPSTIKATVAKMPKAAQESFKNFSVEMVKKGELDSVKRIKVLDEIYDIELSLVSELY